MGVCQYGDGRIKYHPEPLEHWTRVGWNIRQIIVETMNQLAVRYRGAR
jgi:hypothetical protein